MSETEELLTFIYHNTEMGKKSSKKLLSLIKEKDNKIKFLLEEEMQKYDELYKRCKKLMKKENIETPSSKILANLTGNVAMTMEVGKDNSDSKIASILIRGFNMGNIDIGAKIKDFKKEAKDDSIDLANDLLKFGEKQIKLLKEYL